MLCLGRVLAIPANYRIASAAGQPATALPGVSADDIALSTDSATGVSTARITLSAGSELFAGNVIRVVDDAISAAGALDDRRVEEFEFTVPTPAGAITVEGITAAVGSREITVVFTQPVNDAASGETDFASSAANPANYEIDGVALAANTGIVLSADRMTATITLLDTVLPVVAGNTVSVVDNQIRAAFDDRLVAAAERSFPATTTSITVTGITAAVGSGTITVTFSAPVSSAASGTAGFAASAVNPANYRINRESRAGDYQLSADGTVLTIALGSGAFPTGLTDGSLIEVLGGVIKGAAASDARLVDPFSVVVRTTGVQPATLITVDEITATAGGLRITVVFSEAVSDAASGTGARNPAHYRLDPDGSGPLTAGPAARRYRWRYCVVD